MRKSHELVKGIRCERCSKIAYKGDYKRISIRKAIKTSRTGEVKTINGFNLCNECYHKYMLFTTEFLYTDKDDKRSAI